MQNYLKYLINTNNQQVFHLVQQVTLSITISRYLLMTCDLVYDFLNTVILFVRETITI